MICCTGIDRIDSRVVLNPSTGCWLFTGYLGQDGRPRIQVERDGKRTSTTVYREVWKHYNGRVPGGLELDHACRVRHCVRPDKDHVRAVTHRENLKNSTSRSGDAMRREVCIRGHAYTDSNTRWKLSRSGGPARECRACRAQSMRERRKERRAA